MKARHTSGARITRKIKHFPEALGVYLKLQKRFADCLRSAVRSNYGIELDAIPVEVPPHLEFGDLATPIAFELARKLRKAPRAIAQEIAVLPALAELDGFEGFTVAGAGFINARFNRRSLAQNLAAGQTTEWKENLAGPVNVEHSSINPNKAAHIGHLRNAILGDTLARILRKHGFQVVVQNYIDNTGVQVADIVVALKNLELDTIPGLPVSEQHTLFGIKKRIARLF